MSLAGNAVVRFLLALIVASPTSCRATRTPQADSRYVQQLQPLLEQFVQWQENVEFYPVSARAADALGTAYEMDHNLPAAIRAYQTAVKLDPTLSHAKERLRQLQ